jgi:hypothetical protein
MFEVAMKCHDLGAEYAVNDSYSFFDGDLAALP